MKASKKEELQSRREFFKSAAKTALPVVGAVLLSNLPILVKATETTSCDGCYYSCYGSCKGSCYGSCESCNGRCASDCQNSCLGGCVGTCTGGCDGTCYGSCYSSNNI